MEIRTLEQLRDLSSLSRAIFQSNVPEQLVKELPAQTLYQVICYNGLESSVDLIEALAPEQMRSLLDFDLWNADTFIEDNLWNWLELTSEDDELLVMQRVVSSLDLKLVALMISRYAEIQSNEEPTDTAPGPLFFTPDSGYTWIRVLCEDQRQHFLFSKLLAFLFESNSDVFYQLLATKAVTTPSILEEEAFNDRIKRLSAEGIPDTQLAAEVTSFISVADALKELGAEKPPTIRHDSMILEPLVRMSEGLEPLTSALRQVEYLEEGLSELSLVANAALVRFKVLLSDSRELNFITSQVHGALNIGLEILSKRSGMTASEVLNKVGFQITFRVGLSQILDIAKLARKYSKKLIDSGFQIEPATQAMLDLLGKAFPAIPASLSQQKNDYTLGDSSLAESDTLEVRPEPFRYYAEIELLKSKFSQ